MVIPEIPDGTTKAEAALIYARAGIPVFPCNQDKSPNGRFAPNGFHDATTNEQIVAGWWRRDPDFNIGSPLDDHTIALDVDDTTKAKPVTDLLSKSGPVQITGGATDDNPKHHRIYDLNGHDPSNLITRIAELGIETKGLDKGYILLAPSTTTGTYRWRRTGQPDALPDSLYATLTAKRTKDKAKAPDEPFIRVTGGQCANWCETTGPIPRNPGGYQYLNDFAVHRVTYHRDTQPDAILDALLPLLTRMSPPYPAGEGVDLVHRITEQIVRDIKAGKIGPDGSWTHADQTTPPRSGPLVESVLDLIKDADKPLVWAWDRSILLGSLTQALGRWESFKSMGLQSLLVASYFGESWLNRDTLQLPVAYISNEKTRQTIGKRFAAMIDKRPVDPDRFLVVHRKGVQIGGRYWDEVLEAVYGLGESNLVVLDTLASLSKAGFKENTSEDMGAVLAGIRLLTSECRSTVILAHHPAKAGGGMGRGHGSLDGEVDGTLEFIRSDRRDNLGQIDIRPKDGDFHPVQFAWDPVTYLFSDAGPLACSPASVAAFVQRRWADLGDPTPTEVAEKYFVSVSPRTVQRHLKVAVDLGLIEVLTGGAGGLVTVYRPVGAP